MFEGQHIVVFDTETLRSAHDCLYCGQALDDPRAATLGPCVAGQVHTPIGWDRKQHLGLSIACWFDYKDMAYHWFDVHTLEATIRRWVHSQPLLVSFNGLEFDGPLLRTLLRRCLPQPDTHPEGAASVLHALCADFAALILAGYDVLQACWQAVPRPQRTKGAFTLDALSQANGYGSKTMPGALAPRLWAQGRYAEVIEHNYQDVVKTRNLFEHIVRTGRLTAGDGREVVCSPPPLERWSLGETYR